MPTGSVPPRRVRFLALDIDGTTIRDDGTVSTAVIDAVGRARRAGVHVVLCTGRPYHVGVGGIAAALRLTDDTAPGAIPQAIVNNGSASISLIEGAVRWERLVPAMHGRAIVEAIESVGATPLVEQAPSDGPRMFTWDTRDAHSAARWYAHAWMRIDDVEPVGRDTLLRTADRATWIGACGDHDTTKRALDRLSRFAAGPDPVDLVWSASWLHATAPNHVVGVRPAGVHKAYGLARYAAEFGATLEDGVAVGDEMNDLEMVCDVGLGIAMGQAPRALKAVARAIVASNEDDGVVEAIERFVLPYA